MFLFLYSAIIWHWGPRDSVSSGTSEPGVRLHPFPRSWHQGYSNPQECAIPAQWSGYRADVRPTVPRVGRPRAIHRAVQPSSGGAISVSPIPPNGWFPWEHAPSTQQDEWVIPTNIRGPGAAAPAHDCAHRIWSGPPQQPSERPRFLFEHFSMASAHVMLAIFVFIFLHYIFLQLR